MRTLRIVAWASVLWMGLAWGQIYKWTDHQGITHFSDDPSRIPAEYRAAVEVEKVGASTPPPSPSHDSTQSAQSDLAPSGVSPLPVPQRDRLGRGPDYWGTLVQRATTQLQQSIEERHRLQLLSAHTRQLANGTRDVWDRGRLEMEAIRLETAIAEVEAQINAAAIMLQTTLPIEAVRLGADLNWLKPPAAALQ